jgi:hypothetical protein
MADFWVHKYEDFEAAFMSQEYKEKVQPDELNFVDVNSIAITVGVEGVFVDDGKFVEKHERTEF